VQVLQFWKGTFTFMNFNRNAGKANPSKRVWTPPASRDESTLWTVGRPFLAGFGSSARQYLRLLIPREQTLGRSGRIRARDSNRLA